MADRRYNIGLIVGNVEDDFSNSICKGAIQAAEELNDNLFIIPVKYIDYFVKDDPLMCYEYQYNTLLNYARVTSLDIILLCLGTIGYTTTKERCDEILASFKGYPVILIACDEEGHSCVRYNNGNALSEGISHLITVENRKHIGMITGFLSNIDSKERLDAYKQTLTQHGLPIIDSAIKITIGDSDCAPDVEPFLDANPDMDAIVCGNDSIAQAVYAALNKRRILIGSQMSVIGFDDINDAKYMTPPLATVRANASELGFRAVLQGHRKLLEGTVSQPETFFVDTKFVYRDSIGINSSSKVISQKQTDDQDRLFGKVITGDENARLIRMNHSMNILSRNMLTLNDNGEQNYTQILDCLSIANLKSCFLYTLKKPYAYRFGDTWKQPESLYLRAYLENDKAVAPRKTAQLIKTDNIFNHQFMPNERKTYVMIDLYARELQYGFMLCDISYNNFHYVEFLCYQVSIAIKLMHMFDMRRALLAEKDDLVLRLQSENLQLDAISGKDELSGILNRRGFYKKIGTFIEEERPTDKQLIFAYADLNYLKQINDLYGHPEGDFAIQSCATAFELIFPNCIAGRIGGDEFAVLSVCDKTVTKESLREAMNTYLADVSAKAGKPYTITVSIGIWSPAEGETFQLETAIEMADALLYEEKKHKPPFGKIEN
ncbi:MAG: GGDEF domain-containing protein [Lachnospiraceae bacterium]|nr:GGDEF domain-containing protein [Lachnospiraceae bacterium]